METAARAATRWWCQVGWKLGLEKICVFLCTWLWIVWLFSSMLIQSWNKGSHCFKTVNRVKKMHLPQLKKNRSCEIEGHLFSCRFPERGVQEQAVAWGVLHLLWMQAANPYSEFSSQRRRHLLCSLPWQEVCKEMLPLQGGRHADFFNVQLLS